MEAARVLRGAHKTGAHGGGNIETAVREKENIAPFQNGAAVCRIGCGNQYQAVSVSRRLFHGALFYSGALFDA